MKWYEGSIPDAIQLAKTKGSVFIVYITGQDEDSKKMDSVWEERSVIEACQQQDCVAIKLAAKSDTCAQFSMYYPVVVVPSVFFIGNNGVALEVTGGALSSEDFLVKVQTALQAHKQQSSSTSSPPSTSSPTNSTQSSPSSEQVKRAQQLIQERQAKKLEEEKQKKINEEKERRQLGRTMLDSKQKKEEIEAREIQKELKRQKEEDRKARERVKEQIARDRAERAAKYQKEKENIEKERSEGQRARLVAEEQAAAEETARRNEFSRLQFRLPDGSSVTQTFPSTEPLSSARNFISQHLGPSFGCPSLSTIYPRRSFSNDDMVASLSTLELCPSAVIMVLPEQRSSSTVSTSGGGILALIMAPLVAIWGFLYNIIVGAPSTPRGVYNPQQSARPGQSMDSDDDNVPSEVTQTNRPRTAYKRRSPANVSKREGNIHKFSNVDDDDEDMTTWNGNSTQQM